MTEDCSTEEERDRILCILFISRDDEVPKAILPAIEQTLLRYRSGAKVPPAAPFLFELRPSPEGSDASLVASGKSPGSGSSCSAAAKELSEARIASNARVSHPSFAALPQDVRNHCRLLVESVVFEREHKKLGGFLRRRMRRVAARGGSGPGQLRKWGGEWRPRLRG